MNPLILRVLQDPEYVKRIRQRLPPAFEAVQAEAEGPEVGVLRQPVLVAMFMAFLGEEQVVALRKVHPDTDCLVGGQPLSIKTVSQQSGIRIKWTANQVKAQEFMKHYAPVCDLLVARIVWEGDGYLQYIPLEAQQEVYAHFGPPYLDYRAATNTRGVNLSVPAEETLAHHAQTHTLPIHWYLTGSTQSPYQRWLEYWRSP